MIRGGESVIAAMGVSMPLAKSTTAQSCSAGSETGFDFAWSGHACAAVLEWSQLWALGLTASIINATTNTAHSIANVRCSERGA